MDDAGSTVHADNSWVPDPTALRLDGPNDPETTSAVAIALERARLRRIMFAPLAPNMLPHNNLIQVRRGAANGMRGIVLVAVRQASHQQPAPKVGEACAKLLAARRRTSGGGIFSLCVQNPRKVSPPAKSPGQSRVHCAYKTAYTPERCLLIMKSIVIQGISWKTAQ